MTELPKLAAPARRALAAEDITCVEDFEKLTRTQLEELHGIGPNALRAIEEAMSSAGVRFLDE